MCYVHTQWYDISCATLYVWLGNLTVLCAVHRNVYQHRDVGTRREAACLKSLKPEVSTK